MTNQLGVQTSPYLLQHKDNPVHWWAWGDDALNKAKAENKPILLSIGYAACHWCHVMAHESFENPEIAAVMNKHFINIKLDREERPDLDGLYQQALSVMGQQGGWPLTMFLTPDGVPFWGGTYFPPKSAHGRPGFVEVMEALSETYAKNHGRVQENAQAMIEALKEANGPQTGQMVSFDLIDHGALQILAVMDTKHGGLQGAPKFPQTGILEFLLRTGLRTQNAVLVESVLFSLERMCQGGIYDHLAGGFMRYSTDEKWLVPHFEKMLYDNALLIELLSTAYQTHQNPLFKTRVEETIAWLTNEMQIGASFAATLDADSEGKEGAFYVWKADEIDAVLGEDAHAFRKLYDVSKRGNWERVNILNRSHKDGSGADMPEAIAKLLAVRNTRPRPGRDDKILTDWNAMLVTALVKAAQIFERPDWLDLAKACFTEIEQRHALPDNQLAHSSTNGVVQNLGLLDDLANMARAGLSLFGATGETIYLQKATQWIRAANLEHWDDEFGGYFQSRRNASDLIIPTKPMNDGATPSANGIMAQNLVALWQLTGDASYVQRLEKLTSNYAGQMLENFANMTALLAAHEFAMNPKTVVIMGDLTPDMAQVLRTTPQPLALMFHMKHSTQVPPNLELFKGKSFADKTSIYICKGKTCSAPITTATELKAALS